jgi:hypothetical protein
MHWIQCDNSFSKLLKFSSVKVHQYILVHTGTYFKKLQTSLDPAQSSLQRLQVSTECLAWSFLPVFFLTAVSSTVRPTRRGLPLPKFHSHVLTSYTLRPRLPSEAAVSTHPMGKSEALCLLNLCGIVGVEQWCPAHTPAPQHQKKM